MAIYPTREQIDELMKGPADQPVAMINLFRFKPKLNASDGDTSGQKAYGRYAEQMRKVVESEGGRASAPPAGPHRVVQAISELTGLRAGRL